ncbi:MAG: spore cortex-lytic enzyme [Anaerotignum sp.]|jgi:N-acetylmuramoyl-L-alanine amidase|nr:spore cortex-lytic enzyme [Anaerotignum sp.]MCI8867025.1 spore cortex-lytic enzyme [Anaerotignum sp.]
MGKRTGLIAWGVLLFLCLCMTGGRTEWLPRSAPVPAVNIVSWGTRGSLVRETQQRLADMGYYTGPVDGIFGTRTYEAILEFQENNGLTPDGIAGAATLSALGIPIGTGTSGVGESALSDLEEDLFLLASIIHGEARGEPYEGQVAVGAVVLNRVASENFPNTIAEVIYQRGAFDAVADEQFYLTPNETAIRAAQDALNGWDPTNGALYYWNPVTATSRWIWSIPITTSIGRHVFGTK